MGLTSGPRGPKRYIIEHWPDACGRFDSQDTFVQRAEFDTRRTVLVRDGNVMLMGIPTHLYTFDEVVLYVESTIRRAMRSAHCVIITFDTPENVPRTKEDTQRRRDTATKRRKTTNRTRHNPEELLQDLPTDDAFDQTVLNKLSNCRSLITTRATKYRVFDAIMNAVYKLMSYSTDVDVSLPALFIEGIDERGANRPAYASRQPTILSTNQALLDELAIERDPQNMSCNVTRNIGEADLKLQCFSKLLRRRADLFDAILLETIDTDILPISLIYLAQEKVDHKSATQNGAQAPPEEPTKHSEDETADEYIMGNVAPSPMSVPDEESIKRPSLIICMRERGAHAAKELALANGADVMLLGEHAFKFADAGWLMFDIDILYDSVVQTVPSYVGDHHKEAALIRALCAGWAIDGCDYIYPSLGVADAISNAILKALDPINNSQNKLAELQSVLNHFNANDAAASEASLFLAYTSTSVANKSVSRVRAAQALWSMLYWSNLETPPDPQQFGFPAVE